MADSLQSLHPIHETRPRDFSAIASNRTGTSTALRDWPVMGRLSAIAQRKIPMIDHHPGSISARGLSGPCAPSEAVRRCSASTRQVPVRVRLLETAGLACFTN